MKRKTILCLMLALACVACVTGRGGYQTLPAPEQLTAPTPILGNSGAYLCPYTRDGQPTPWAKSVLDPRYYVATQEAFGAQQASGSMPSGAIAGTKKLRGTDPRARGIALEAAGGMDFIKEKTDISFNSADDLAVYLYARHSMQPDYDKLLKFTMTIYPELESGYQRALVNAPRGGKGR